MSFVEFVNGVDILTRGQLVYPSYFAGKFVPEIAAPRFLTQIIVNIMKKENF